MRGSLRKRGNSWQLLWSVRGADGKRKQECLTVQGTKRDAERRLTEIIRSLDQGTYTKPTRITTGELLDKWLEEHQKQRIAVTTYDRYRSSIKHRLKPALGVVPIASLNPLLVQGMMTEWAEEGLSPATISFHYKVLRQALDTAVRWELMQRNPAAAVSAPPRVRNPQGILDDDQMKHLLQESRRSVYHLPIVLALTTGLRCGEICGLKWEDIDFEEEVLTVRRQAVRLSGGRLILKAPKTKSSARQVSLVPLAVGVLQQQERTCEMVVASRALGVLSPNALAEGIKRFCRALGIDTTAHGLRHTHASLLMRMGEHPKLVSERLGHADIGMTLNTYSHVLPSQQKALAGRVGEVLALPE